MVTSGPGCDNSDNNMWTEMLSRNSDVEEGRSKVRGRSERRRPELRTVTDITSGY